MEAIHLDSCNGCILWRRSEPDNFATAQLIKIVLVSQPQKPGREMKSHHSASEKSEKLTLLQWNSTQKLSVWRFSLTMESCRHYPEMCGFSPLEQPMREGRQWGYRARSVIWSGGAAQSRIGVKMRLSHPPQVFSQSKQAASWKSDANTEICSDALSEAAAK